MRRCGRLMCPRRLCRSSLMAELSCAHGFMASSVCCLKTTWESPTVISQRSPGTRSLSTAVRVSPAICTPVSCLTIDITDSVAKTLVGSSLNLTTRRTWSKPAAGGDRLNMPEMELYVLRAPAGNTTRDDTRASKSLISRARNFIHCVNMCRYLGPALSARQEVLSAAAGPPGPGDADGATSELLSDGQLPYACRRVGQFKPLEQNHGHVVIGLLDGGVTPHHQCIVFSQRSGRTLHLRQDASSNAKIPSRCPPERCVVSVIINFSIFIPLYCDHLFPVLFGRLENFRSPSRR